MSYTNNNIFINANQTWSGTRYSLCSSEGELLYTTECSSNAHFALHCLKNPELLCSLSDEGIKFNNQHFGTINKLITKNGLGRPVKKSALSTSKVFLTNGSIIDLDLGLINYENKSTSLLEVSALSEALTSFKSILKTG